MIDERAQPIAGPYVLRLVGWTLDRYLADAPESALWEFVRGEVIVYSPASVEHQRLVGFLFSLLRGFCEARGWGEVLAAPAAVQVLPDVVRVLPPEAAPGARGVPLAVRPVWIGEITSPSTRNVDLGEKAEDYRQAGVAEYWVVDRERRELVVHRLVEGRYELTRREAGRLASSAVPGFWLEVGWFRAEPLPPVASCLRQVLGGPAGGS